jgi:hypothetical protein
LAQWDGTLFAAACAEAIALAALRKAAELALDPAYDRYRRPGAHKPGRLPASFVQLALRTDPMLREFWRDWPPLSQLSAFFLDSHASSQLVSDGHSDAERKPSTSVVGKSVGKSPTAPGRELSVVEEQSDDEAETSASLSMVDGEAIAAAAAVEAPRASARKSADMTDAGVSHDLSQERWSRKAGDAITEVEAEHLLSTVQPTLTTEHECSLFVAALARQVLSEVVRRAGVGRLGEAPPKPVTAHDVAAAAGAWLPPLARQVCIDLGRMVVSAFALVWKPPDKCSVRVTWLRGNGPGLATVGSARTVSLGPDDNILEAVTRCVRGMRIDADRVVMVARGNEIPSTVTSPPTNEQMIEAAAAAKLGEAAASLVEGTPRAMSTFPTVRNLVFPEAMDVFAIDRQFWEHRRREAARRGVLTSTRNNSSQVQSLRKRAESKVKKMRQWEDGVPLYKGKTRGEDGKPKVRPGEEEGSRIPRSRVKMAPVASSGYGQADSGAPQSRVRGTSPRAAPLPAEEEASPTHKPSRPTGMKRPPPQARRRPREKDGSSRPEAGEAPVEVRAARALLKSCESGTDRMQAALVAATDMITRLKELSEAESISPEAIGKALTDDAEEERKDPSHTSKVTALRRALQDARDALDAAVKVASKVESRKLLGTG